ncbi:ABCG43, partial [Symbiodinium microadriaticum]
MAAVDEALDLLELRPVEHRAIGDEKAGWGLSRGERKRARDVARVIRRVADSGRTVVCTLHQPSAGVWSAMDDLLLLARGGYTVYYGPLGPGSRTMVDYLESLPGSHPLPDGMNPADYMLDVIGSEGKTDAKVAGVRAAAAPAGGEPALASRASTDAAGAHAEGKPAAAAAAAPTRAQLLRGKFIESAAKATLDETLDGMGIERDSHSRRLAKTSVAADAHGDASRPNFCVQFAMLTKRASVDFFRDTDFGLKRCVLFVLLALISGGVFFQIEDVDQAGVASLVGGVVMGVIFVSAITANTTSVAIGKRRPSFTREQAAHTFDPTAYGL